MHDFCFFVQSFFLIILFRELCRHDKLKEPWSGHPYTSHICQFDVFPRFDPGRTEFDGERMYLIKIYAYSATRLTVATQQTFNFDSTSTQQPMQRCSIYNRANVARRGDCQSNSHPLIGVKVLKNFVWWPR